MPNAWWIKGLAPSRRSQNPCKFPLPSWKKVLKEQRGEGNLQIKIYLWDEKEHIWRTGFSFPLTHFWRCAANPIIKLEKTSDIWEMFIWSRNQLDKDAFRPPAQIELAIKKQTLFPLLSLLSLCSSIIISEQFLNFLSKCLSQYQSKYIQKHTY